MSFLDSNLNNTAKTQPKNFSLKEIFKEIKEFPKTQYLIEQIFANIEKLHKNSINPEILIQKNQHLFSNAFLTLSKEAKQFKNQFVSNKLVLFLKKLQNQQTQIEAQIQKQTAQQFTQEQEQDEEDTELLESNQIMQQIQYHEEEIIQNESRIQNVYNNMKDIQTLYNEMSQIANTQHEQCEVIEVQSEQIVHNLDQANKEIKKTVKAQESSKKNLCYLLCSILILFILLIYLIKL